jgi:hypothetical protein
VEFKLHAPFGTIIVGKVKNGELTCLEVNPQERLKDVIVVSPAEIKMLGHCRVISSSGAGIKGSREKDL